MKLTVAHDLLADDELTRAQELARYFGQLTVESCWQSAGWQLVLGRPSAPAYLDPDLAQGLAWWSDRFTSIGVADIGTAVYRDAVLQIALEDSWTLYAWSNWLARAPVGEARPACVTLLHLDEHDDLMSPRLLATGDCWRDAITGKTVDIQQPESIAAAIHSGAISIGNFIAPLGHWLPELHIRHLRQCPGADKDAGMRTMHPIWQPDTLLAPGYARPALELSNSNASTGLPGQHTYLCTVDSDLWLANLPPGPILLHLDLDYFNNRYDGNPEWQRITPDLNPPLTAILARIDEVFAVLTASNLAPRIVDYSIALSPDFFPASMWSVAAQRVMTCIYRLHATVNRE
jgi:hypothetical protein